MQSSEGGGGDMEKAWPTVPQLRKQQSQKRLDGGCLHRTVLKQISWVSHLT